MNPDVLNLIVCQSVETDSVNYHRINVFGLVTSIQPISTPAFPAIQDRLAVLLLWCGGQGTGELIVRIVEDRTANLIIQTRSRRVRFLGDPLAVGGIVFHIRNCSFPMSGLYWVEVLFAGSVIARQRLFVKN